MSAKPDILGVKHISLAHGNGGRLMRELIEQIFARHLSNPLLDVQADAEYGEDEPQQIVPYVLDREVHPCGSSALTA